MSFAWKEWKAEKTLKKGKQKSKFSQKKCGKIYNCNSAEKKEIDMNRIRLEVKKNFNKNSEFQGCR